MVLGISSDLRMGICWIMHGAAGQERLRLSSAVERVCSGAAEKNSEVCSRMTGWERARASIVFSCSIFYFRFRSVGFFLNFPRGRSRQTIVPRFDLKTKVLMWSPWHSEGGWELQNNSSPVTPTTDSFIDPDLLRIGYRSSPTEFILLDFSPHSFSPSVG